MTREHLTIYEEPELKETRLIIGLSGWMNGGEVATGTIQHLLDNLTTRTIAAINPKGLYLYNFPASMEVAAMFRPYTDIRDGMVKEYELPSNVLHCDVQNNLILFTGREPNINWEIFTECIFDIVSRFQVHTVYFLGSFGGVVPHTRDPRLHSTVSEIPLKEEMTSHSVRLLNYEGPAGLVTHLLQAATDRSVRMASLVAELPAYLQGRNPRGVQTLTRKLGEILGIELDLSALDQASVEYESRVAKMIQTRGELSDMIHKLESQYDSDYLTHEMGDLKEWLEEQGFHLN